MFASVLRSKGTCWINEQHRVEVEWSHAGRHFRLTPAGTWWATLPDPVVRACLSSTGEDTAADTPAYRAERAKFEGEWGDRRQEVVFIGVRLDEEAIRKALDSCLATDEEMLQYEAIWSIDESRLADTNGEVTPFRFAVGDKVECCLGEDDWEVGKVVKLYYRDPQWEPERWMPYQIQLDSGDLIFAPADLDACIRSASA